MKGWNGTGWRVHAEEDDSVLHALAETIELKDPYTRGHCERVAVTP
jgi:HD-GYP domain-containing protein (c-di-GMP phosphodiesterase class II)